LEIPSPSSSPLLTLSAINSSCNTLSDEWVLVIAFNVIVRMPASVLAAKISIDTVGNMDINITADDGTNTPATQAFTIAVITDIPDITPVIKQFTVTWYRLR
jgi:hypothetical protein